jgi:hypothetical protein
MEINVEEIKIKRIARQPCSITIMFIPIIWVALYQMMQGIHVKINPELSWQKQHSTTRIVFSKANWT